MNVRIVALVTSLFITSLLYSQIDSLDIENLTREDILELTTEDLLSLPLPDLMAIAEKLGVSIDELLNMQISVSSKKAMTTRESPGILTIITKEEIEKSGARDLIDLLSLVPGFFFGYDLDGAVGLGARGNWGLEGKILVLIDGQEMNEGMYTTVNFGNHFVPSQIERIEIIRGPGSSIYGGYAELGVINIVTKSVKTFDHINVYGSAGTMPDAISRYNGGVNVFKKVNNTDISVLGFYGGGHRTDKIFTDFYGDEYDLGDIYTEYQTYNVNCKVTSGSFSSNFIYDEYSTNVTGYSDGTFNRFRNILGELKYTYKVNDKLSIIPKINYKHQLPYNMEDTSWYYRKDFQRVNAEVGSIWEATSWFSMVGGVAAYSDYANDQDDDPEAVFYNDSKKLSMYNLSGYLQGVIKTPYSNFIIGGRVDHHEIAGTNFSPRLGITNIISKFHYKILYSNAFRTPSIENFNLNEDIKPEKTNVLELETGYQLNKNMFLTANIFDITINDPIIYEYDPDTEEEYYSNYDKTGSRGAELEFRALYNKFYITAGYAYYTAAGKNKVTAYEVEYPEGEIHDDILKGAPMHKFSFNGNVSLTKKLTINASMALWGVNYGFSDNDSLQTKIDLMPMVNLYLKYNDILVKGLDIGIGCYNLLNQDFVFIQPYGTPFNVEKAYPAQSIEALIKISYDFRLK
ncbi:MAG: TonB-dependent receptor plug domain-containing protein [Bacteroidales bacterium]|nr:TonB-dependent receptor plug domain-containing protein [Bacteroidales bacterium]